MPLSFTALVGDLLFFGEITPALESLWNILGVEVIFCSLNWMFYCLN